MQSSYSKPQASNQDFYAKIHEKVINLMNEGKISSSAVGLYTLLVFNSKKFNPSRAWILKRGFKKDKLLVIEKELEAAGVLKIKRGKGGRSFTTYHALNFDDLSEGKKFKQSENPTVGKSDSVLSENPRATVGKSESQNGLLSEKPRATVGKTESVMSENPTLLITNTITNNNNTPLTPHEGEFEKYYKIGLSKKEAKVIDKYLKPTERNLEALRKCKKPASRLDLSAFFEQALGHLERVEPRGNDRRLTPYQIKKLISGVYGNLAVIEMENKREAEREIVNKKPQWQKPENDLETIEEKKSQTIIKI